MPVLESTILSNYCPWVLPGPLSNTAHKQKQVNKSYAQSGSSDKGIAWVRGNLERRGEFWMDIKSWIAIAVAVATVIFAQLK